MPSWIRQLLLKNTPSGLSPKISGTVKSHARNTAITRSWVLRTIALPVLVASGTTSTTIPLAVATSGTATYIYDNAGRLRQVAVSSDGAFTTYVLDAAGNRQSVAATFNRGTLQFAQASYSVAESGGTVQLSVTRTGTTNGAILIHYASADGTATAGSDYTAVSGTLNWGAGDSGSKTISIPIANDAVREGDETFTVALSGPSLGVTLGSATNVPVTIVDDDLPVISIANVSVNEGAGTATFTVTKANATTLTHVVNYATANGTATSPADYTATSGTLTFAPADTTKTFTVPITNDSVYEAAETFTATLSAPTNGAVLGTATGTATIVDNDTPPSFAINSVTVSEAVAGGMAVFTVTKTGSTAISHSVNFATANGTGIAGSDYTAISGTLTFASTDATKTISVPIINNAVYKPNPTFTGPLNPTYTVNLSAPTNAATLSVATGNGTIQEDEAPDIFSNTVSLTVGTFGAVYGTEERGYYPPQMSGSVSPATLSGGKTITAMYEADSAVESVYFTLSVSGFAADPGTAWLTSVTAMGATKNSPDATYSYSAGSASWRWATGFTLPRLTTQPVTLVHRP